MFISSNPSINESECYPLQSWEDEEINDFFKNRFLENVYVKNSLYPKLRGEFANHDFADSEGYHKTWVRYWGYVRSISRQLLGRDVVPGKDYTLMEVVRCKSKGELGVKDVMGTCATKYLNKTLSLSLAKVIVVVGDKAKKMLVDHLSIDFKSNYHIEKEIGGRNRMIFVLPHSNARVERGLKILLPESIKKVQDTLINH